MIAGEGPAPALVLQLVQRLPDSSLTAALASGGRHLFGYSRIHARLDDLFDALNVNTRATGNWANKPPEIPPVPRPQVRKDDEGKPAKRMTVRELYARFNGGK